MADLRTGRLGRLGLSMHGHRNDRTPDSRHVSPFAAGSRQCHRTEHRVMESDTWMIFGGHAPDFPCCYFSWSRALWLRWCGRRIGG